MSSIAPLSEPSDLARVTTQRWTVTLFDADPATSIEYFADTDTISGLATALTEVWRIGHSTIKISTADFAYQQLDEYHYFFKQKAQSSFFHSKRKTVERKTKIAQSFLESRSAVGVYRFGPDGGRVDITGADPITDSGPETETGTGPAPRVQVTHLDVGPPYARLTVIWADLAGAVPLFARLTGAELDDARFELFRKSSSRVKHVIDDVRSVGWRARSYFFDPFAA
ncbi:MAG: hypothetical protein AAGF33_14595 [Pseudomonadota bacterium]